MTPLIDRFMAGLELRDPTVLGPRTLDFCVSNETQTLCLFTDWWSLTWGIDTGMMVLPAVLNPATLQFDALPDWHLGTATDERYEARLAGARLRTDADRARYLLALQRLVSASPEYDLLPWIEAVLARPTVDVLAVKRQQATELRTVGYVRLLESEGRVVDALAIDERGATAGVLDGSWLALFGEQWSGYAEGARPDLESFLGWVAQQVPYGLFSVEQPWVTREGGDLQGLVERAFAQNPTT